MNVEKLEFTSSRKELLKIRDDGAIDLIHMWNNRELHEDFDLGDFFSDKGVKRLIAYLTEETGEEVVDTDTDNDEVWVHPLVMYSYLAWCEPRVALMSLDTYHEMVQAQSEAFDILESETATRH